MKHSREDYNERIQDSAGLIPEDEPVFLLRAQDKFAANVMEYYAYVSRKECPELSQTVTKHAELFEQWPVKKTPDLPRGAEKAEKE